MSDEERRRPRVCICRGYTCHFRGTAEEVAHHEAKCDKFIASEGSNRRWKSPASREVIEFVDGLIARAEAVSPGTGVIISLSADEFEKLKEFTKNG